MFGVDEAVRVILSEDNAFFTSVMDKLFHSPDLKDQLRSLRLHGETIPYLSYNEKQNQLRKSGVIQNNHNTVAVSNRIFAMRLYCYFISESRKYEDLKQISAVSKSAFVDDSGLDVPGIMSHYIQEHSMLYERESVQCLEKEGRKRFITFAAFIINGTGTYHIDPQTRDHRRMDLVVLFRGQRYIIELKIWHSDRYDERGERQISEYLDR